MVVSILKTLEPLVLSPLVLLCMCSKIHTDSYFTGSSSQCHCIVLGKGKAVSDIASSNQDIILGKFSKNCKPLETPKPWHSKDLIMEPGHLMFSLELYFLKPELTEIPSRPPLAEKSVEDQAFHLAQKNITDPIAQVHIVQADIL